MTEINTLIQENLWTVVLDLEFQFFTMFSFLSLLKSLVLSIFVYTGILLPEQF